MSGNPKNIKGYKNPPSWYPSLNSFKYAVYCSCSNCGERWEFEAEGYGGVAGYMTQQKYDKCSECTKDEPTGDKNG